MNHVVNHNIYGIYPQFIFYLKSKKIKCKRITESIGEIVADSQGTKLPI